jgi:UDP-N-acetylglucosamine:LPS N-acetylglucosamine transferase
VRADDPATLAYRLQDLLHHPARLITMRERAQALAKPHAAAVVFDTVLRLNATIPTRT